MLDRCSQVCLTPTSGAPSIVAGMSDPRSASHGRTNPERPAVSRGGTTAHDPVLDSVCRAEFSRERAVVIATHDGRPVDFRSPAGRSPRVDVVVVGAGPAGSTAARLLAARGARVVLVEARRLPRPKLCGGGLTPKAQRLAPPGALSTVERTVERTELRAPRLSPIHLEAPAASVAMVERARFDLALVEAAAAAGADVRDGVEALDVKEDPFGARVATEQGRLRADALVLADGEPSRLARRLGLGGDARRLALALEVDLPFSAALALDVALLEFAVPGGYAWYFPKGDHASVGIGSYRPSQHRELKTALRRFAGTLDLDAAAGRLSGHWIPQGLRRGPMASARVVLAGDAAATADPLFGEGISYAMISGAVAAQVVADWEGRRVADLRAYDERLRRVLGPALGRLYWTARAVEASLDLALTAVRHSRHVRDQAVDAIAGRRGAFAVDRDCRFACVCALIGRVCPACRAPSGPGPSCAPPAACAV